MAAQAGVYQGIPPSMLVALGNLGGREKVATLRTVTGTLYLRLADCNCIDATLIGNTTFVMPAARPGDFTSFTLIVRQDATGSRTLTWPSTATLLWTGGAAPTATTTASSIDAYAFWTVNGRLWHGARVGAAYA